MHSSRMRTAHSSSRHGGGLHTHTPLEQAPTGAATIPGAATPWSRPPRVDPPPCGPGDLPWPDPPQLPPWV